MNNVQNCNSYINLPSSEIYTVKFVAVFVKPIVKIYIKTTCPQFVFRWKYEVAVRTASPEDCYITVFSGDHYFLENNTLHKAPGRA
jgi:hypothetical protein